ncbi:poly-gamma-glutamate capsule biosynthesis protein CapA/YwtB (metallophosphatase superfamily) [Parabacteroides sp. PM5-20]|nr:poly-gamma-glutamate capsule biosynthesis protein CapA/YwtB (metallophosphatase superfamily) [Parabacteroides sp. PM5-20]
MRSAFRIFTSMKQTKYIVPVLVTFLFAGLIIYSTRGKASVEETIEKETVVLPDTLKLLFVGDVMVHSRQFEAALYEGGDSMYNFHPTLQYIQEYISSADFSMANLEVPFGGKPYTGYPMFSSPPEIVDDLIKAGFNVFFTANNHVADKGKKGIEGTLEHLKKSGASFTGSFKDSLERAENYPLLVEAKNIKLCLLNYTYGTNGMPVYKPNLVNRIDTLQIKKDLEKAKSQAPDYIITCIHWGEEYQQKENENQRELARFLAENGSNLIVGAHPHVVQPFDKIITQKGDTVPVIYSLGNFVSNQRWRYSDCGIVFEVILVKSENRLALHSVAYEPFWVNRYNDHIRSLYRIIPVNDYLRDSTKYELNAVSRGNMMQFYDDARKTLQNLTYSNFYKKKSRSHL